MPTATEPTERTGVPGMQSSIAVAVIRALADKIEGRRIHRRALIADAGSLGALGDPWAGLP
jgi:hypothetical protein